MKVANLNHTTRTYEAQEQIVREIIKETPLKKDTDFKNVDHKQLLDTATKLVNFMKEYTFASPLIPLKGREKPEYAGYMFHDTSGRSPITIELEATVNWGLTLNSNLSTCLSRTFEPMVNPQVEATIKTWFKNAQKCV